MIYLELFLTFLKIGAVSFGGGYGMISLIREETLAHGWLTEGGLMNFIAVSESTPGPLAVNMATFVGSAQGGIWGALAATAGVVLPAFIIILLIAAVLKNILKYEGVRAVLGGIRPAVTGLIISTAAITFLSVLFSVKTVHSSPEADLKGLIILGVLAAISAVYKLTRKKSLSPILLILMAGAAGVALYYVPVAI